MEFREISKLLEDKIQELGLITIREAAELRKTSRSAVLQLIQRGRLKTETVIGKQFVYRKEVEGFTPDRPGPHVSTLQR